ncbi:MAG: hypothetical protein GX369_06340 [Euryarchaeota archaeon]|nr:hypothetical protein [Euryarchaeota archaeon]
MEVASEEYKRSALPLFTTLAFASAILAALVGYFIDDIGPIYSLFVPVSLLIIGALVKYGDQAFDSDAYCKKTAIYLALPTGVWLGALIMLDESIAVIFIGMLLALLVARKYDNVAFRLAFAVAITLSLAALLIIHGNISLIGIAVTFILALLDEKIDALPADDDYNTLAIIMRQRPLLKIGVFVLCITGVLPSFIYLFAFLSFDFGYSMVDVASTLR